MSKFDRLLRKWIMATGEGVKLSVMWLWKAWWKVIDNLMNFSYAQKSVTGIEFPISHLNEENFHKDELKICDFNES